MTAAVSAASLTAAIELIIDAADASRALFVLRLLVQGGPAAQDAARAAGVFEFVARTIRIAPDALRSARALVAAATESSPDSRESAISALAATRAADAVAPAPPCLCAAASMGDGAIRTVEAMLDAGADADGCNGKRCLRPLAESAYADSAKVTRALIRRGAGVNKRNRGDRSTPLHWCKSAKIASILMQNGAKMHLRDRYNDTPRMRHQRHNTAWVIETAESASSGAAAASGSDCD